METLEKKKAKWKAILDYMYQHGMLNQVVVSQEGYKGLLDKVLGRKVHGVIQRDAILLRLGNKEEDFKLKELDLRRSRQILIDIYINNTHINTIEQLREI